PSIQDGTLAGLAATTVGPDEAFTAALSGKRGPLVLVDRRPRGIKAPLVRTNNRKITRDAVGRLLGLGHTRIAMISGPRDFDTASQRLSGFRLAHRDANRTVDEDLVLHGHLGESGGLTAIRQPIAMPSRPPAGVGFNNLAAAGAPTALRDGPVNTR